MIRRFLAHDRDEVSDCSNINARPNYTSHETGIEPVSLAFNASVVLGVRK